MTERDRSAKPEDLVSVVIPTRNRSDLVTRAVRCVLAQTYRQLEVIVVVDGPDPAASAALARIGGQRLRLVQLPENVGGSEARNIGVREARGEWIAFLDDDDEWLPEKIDKQVQAAWQSAFPLPIVCSKLIVRGSHAEMIWPRLRPYEPISEYLLSRTSWSYGEGLIHTSTILTRRELLLDVPFTTGLRKHQDWDWVLRAVQRPHVGIEFVSKPLAVWNMTSSARRVSTTADWRFSRDWIRSHRNLVTPRAYAGFLLTHCASQASLQRQWSAFVPLLAESCRVGHPRLFDFALYLAAWLSPPQLKPTLVSWLNRKNRYQTGRMAHRISI